MKKTFKHILIIAVLTTAVVSCGDSGEHRDAYTAPATENETEVKEDDKDFKVDVDADDRKIGVESDGVDVNIDGE